MHAPVGGDAIARALGACGVAPVAALCAAADAGGASLDPCDDGQATRHVSIANTFQSMIHFDHNQWWLDMLQENPVSQNLLFTPIAD